MLQKRTSRNNPNATLADGELIHLTAVVGRAVVLLLLLHAHLDHDFPLVHEEAHLHLAAVLGAFEARRRKLDDPRAEEGQGDDLRVPEL